MLSIVRKSEGFKSLNKKRFEAIFKNLPKDKCNTLKSIKEIEESVNSVLAEYEEEIKAVEFKYDNKIRQILEKRNKIINQPKDLNLTNKNNGKGIDNFWYNALSNHKIFKDFINNKIDEKPLKHLIDIRYEKLNYGGSFKLLFEFEKNNYFSNTILEKHYKVSQDHLIESINSTKIDWLDKNNFFVKEKVKYKNKKTGEIKEEDTELPKDSFFNFFCDISLPDQSNIDNIDIDTEKELGFYLDSELEYGMEFIEEFIPNATDYYLAIKYDGDEYSKYCNKENHRKNSY